jgi:glucose/arabinose dehydrogenase
MGSIERTHHRWSLAVTGVLASVIAILLVVLAPSEDAAGQAGPPIGDGTGGVGFAPVGDGNFERPVNVAFAPGSPDSVYVVEQDGTVELLIDNVEAGTALDITNLTNGIGEQGLLGIAFHPDYQTNGLLYAYYTRAGTGDIVVSEFETSGGIADESSRRQVLRIRHRFAGNHNGGQLLFGPDGFLYLGTGDGGDADDPRENAQDKGSLLGKLLRIDPLDPPGARDHRSPTGNPYKGRKGKNEIYARGLRNPFRFTFDPLTARIAIGDVGQARSEEVDYETPNSLRKANFGWDRWEGLKRHTTGGSARTPKRKRHDKPIHVYGHGTDGGSCSITGGVVVRDETLTNLYGRYLFADFCAGQLRSFVPELSGATGVVELDNTFQQPTSFTTSPFTNRIYVTSLTGQVRILVPPPPG